MRRPLTTTEAALLLGICIGFVIGMLAARAIVAQMICRS